MMLSSNIIGQGRRQGRGGSSGSSNLVKWVRGGLIILGACNALFGKAARTERSPEEEKEMLKKEALHLKKRLAVIENRIATLESETQLKVSEYKGNTELQSTN